MLQIWVAPRAHNLCDRTPSLGGPTVRQEATCVATASGPCRRFRGLWSLLLNELVYENTRVFHTIGTLERIISACLEDVEGNMRSHRGGGGVERGGHVLRETTSRGHCPRPVFGVSRHLPFLASFLV
jgi:hypothetical protein